MSVEASSTLHQEEQRRGLRDGWAYAHPMRRREPRLSALFWLQSFLILQFVCQVGLVFGPSGMVRLLLRSAAFAVSLAFLALVPARGLPHPARRSAIAVLAVLALGFLHPNSNFPLAAVAQFSLCAAIIAPVFWVCRLHATSVLLRRVLMMLWLFHTTSAVFGVLEVVYPGRFQANVSKIVTDGTFAEGMKIVLANGQQVWRPMGLTDVPGGAANAGFYAALFGLGFLLHDRSSLMRIASIASMGIGLFCIYMSQVRSILVLLAVCLVVFGVVLWRRGELSRFLGIAIVVPVVVMMSFSWAVAIGGNLATDRLATLIEDKPTAVYYRNRGHFLEHTFTGLLPQYPLGAGLGRWGMMNLYFGDNSDPECGMLWAEIQWTGWLYDGGVFLMLFYSVAIAISCQVVWKISQQSKKGNLELWASLILGYNIGTIALTFNSQVFNAPGGMEFWFLNGCLFAAACSARSFQKVNGTHQFGEFRSCQAV